MHSVLTAVAVLCALLALAGAAYFAMCIVAAKRFQHECFHPSETRFSPPVSILRSLKGLDPRMSNAFRSHCLLDYPEYEVLFGVSDAHDPALALVEKLREEFPQAKLRVVHCPQSLGLNGKVSNLVQMLPHARHEHIIIRSEEHTSELQSRQYLVCRLLL